MRFLVVLILIAASIAFVYSAKTSGPSATLDAIFSRKDRPGTEAKPPEAAHRQSTAVDAQTQETHKQIQREQKVIVNPMLERMLDADKKDAQSMGDDLKAQTLYLLTRIKALRGTLTVWCVAAGAIILVFMFLVRDTGISGVGLTLASLGYNGGRLIIISVSIAGAIAWFGLRYNFLGEMGAAFLGALFALLLLSSVSLKLYDFNAPVWSRMLSSLVWPIIPSVITAF